MLMRISYKVRSCAGPAAGDITVDLNPIHVIALVVTIEETKVDATAPKPRQDLARRGSFFHIQGPDNELPQRLPIV